MTAGETRSTVWQLSGPSQNEGQCGKDDAIEVVGRKQSLEICFSQESWKIFSRFALLAG